MSMVEAVEQAKLWCSSTASGKAGESELWIASGGPRRLPKSVTAQARRYLTELERERDALRTSTSPQAELALFAPAPARRRGIRRARRLARARPNSLSPREALDLLFACSNWTAAQTPSGRTRC